MNGLQSQLVAPSARIVFEDPLHERPGSKFNFTAPWQRVILGIGVAVLAAISAASIALDVQSRSDVAWINHALEVANKLTDTRLIFRRAESAARGYVLTGDQSFLTEYRQSLERIAPAFAELRQAVNDNPSQLRLLADSEPVAIGRFAITTKMVSLLEAGDRAEMAKLIARADGRAMMASIGASFDQLATEEQRLLGIRSAASARTASLLLSINLSCAALILIIAAVLVQEGRLASRRQAIARRASETANETLEAAVAERTRHLSEAHEKLRHSVSVLDSTFSGMAEAVLIVDNEGEVALSNPAAERLLHYCPGMTMVELRAINLAYQPDGLTQLTPDQMPIARALRGEQFDQQEVSVRRPGSREPTYLLVGGRALHDASGAICGASLFYRDVTAARETERELHQAQKLDAIGKLTGGVAHDFNNMLTVITGTAEILVADLGDRPRLLAVASLIDQAADRCAELIRHLLAFARKQPLQPRNVDINDAIVDIAKLLRPTLGEQIEIESILQRDISTALVDPSQLANALINLAINARHAMPNGGRLMLETENVVLDETYARSNLDVRAGRYVMIAISDTGSGMSPEVRERVFEPFFTTKESGKGTGLGLSMVYGFVKQSGGHIRIHSEEGHGTTVRLYLPAISGDADAVVEAIPASPGDGEMILVAEDDALVRGFVIAQLHSLGYRTAAAADGRGVLEYVETGQPFDLLFTDVVLPGGMTGRELADEVIRRRPGTKVLYTSGYTENAIVHDGRLDQGVMLLSKPYRKSALADMIRLALGDIPAKAVNQRLSAPLIHQPEFRYGSNA